MSYINLSSYTSLQLAYWQCANYNSVINAFYATVFLTCHYVIAHDLDMVITVGPCMFMPEANHMPQLVYHNAELVTVLPNWNSLRSIATLPNKRTASASKKNRFDELRFCLPWGTKLFTRLILRLFYRTKLLKGWTPYLLQTTELIMPCILYLLNRTKLLTSCVLHFLQNTILR